MKLWIFATSNNAHRLSGPIKSRFMEFYLQEYSFEEFKEIVVRILKRKYQTEKTMSEKIADPVWNQLKSKDIRDATNIAKLSNTSMDVDWLVKVQLSHGKNPQNN